MLPTKRSQKRDDESKRNLVETLNDQVDNNRAQFFLAFFTVGLFNNNGYVLVQAGANTLAAEFHQGDFMSMF